MQHSDFPDLVKVQKAIRKFEKLKWSEYQESQDVNKFVEDFNEIFKSELGYIINYAMPLKHIEFSFGIYRIREVNTFNNIDLFTEHSYPPPSITKIGRCNFPRYPVFYGSNSPITALTEVVKKGDFSGKRFCISSWGINNSDENLILENFLLGELHPENHFNLLAKSLINRIDEPFNKSSVKLSKTQENGIIEFMKFLDTQFIRDDNYSFSAALAHRRIYANHNNTDILLYPSVQSKFRGINIAINPNFVDNHLRLKRCYIVELKSYDLEKGKFDLKFLEYGEVVKNKFFWRECKTNDAKYENYIREDFKGTFDKKQKF